MDSDKKLAAELMTELSTFEGLEEPQKRAKPMRRREETPADVKQIAEIPNDVSKFAELSIVEKKELEKFIAAKRYAEVKKYPKEKLLAYYLQGLESVDIVKIVPDVSIGGIVYLKAQEQWSEARKEFIEHLAMTSDFKLALTKHRATSILSNILNSWHDKCEKGMADFIRTGNRAYLPANFTIKNFKDYANNMKLLKQLDDMSGKLNKPSDNQNNHSVNIKADSLTIQNPKSEFESKKLDQESQKKLLRQKANDIWQQLESEEENEE